MIIRLLNLRVLLGMLVCCLTAGAQGQALLCKKLTATGNAEYPPYLWRENAESPRLIGANALIFEAISERLGVPIELQYTGPWSRAQQEVRSGRIDLMAGAFITVPRQQWMDYVHPAFLDTTSVVWVRKGRPFSYSRREDLIPHEGITVINNSFGQAFDTFAEQSLVVSTVPSLRQAFKMLNLERVDYLLYEKNPAQAYANLWEIADQVEALQPPISSEGLFLTISHKSSCNNGALRGALARIVGELHADGSMQKALEQGHALWQSRQQ